MTLTEFLLARIAEDEEQANRRFAEWREAGGVLDLVVTLGPARVLAECEAKRRIVKRYLDACEADQSSGTFATVWGERREVLVTLALPYADHPDYREEWRP